VKELYASWGIPVVLLGVVLASCSSKPDPEPCPSFDYQGYSPSADPSFKGDIRPILGTSCAIFTCHGSVDNMPAQEPRDQPLDLGPPITAPAPDDAMVQQIRDNLVDKSSFLARSMVIVKPGAPESSFLMHKIDGDQSCSGFVCPTRDGCGKRMPNLAGEELDQASADQIRAWIKQGAKNN
jgi:hypothetical protein